MIRNVLKRGDPILTQPSAEVVNFPSLEPLIEDLWGTLIAIQGLYKFTGGSGLSAVQIGQPLRVSIV